MTQTELSEILEKHRKWLEAKGGGERAYLREADLCGADLREADLREAKLDNCCLPLGHGGLHIRLTRQQMSQLIYQLCSTVCDDPDVIKLQESMYTFANEFAEGRSDVMGRKFSVEVISDEQSTQTM